MVIIKSNLLGHRFELQSLRISCLAIFLSFSHLICITCFYFFFIFNFHPLRFSCSPFLVHRWNLFYSLPFSTPFISFVFFLNHLKLFKSLHFYFFLIIFSIFFNFKCSILYHSFIRFFSSLTDFLKPRFPSSQSLLYFPILYHDCFSYPRHHCFLIFLLCFSISHRTIFIVFSLSVSLYSIRLYDMQFRGGLFFFLHYSSYFLNGIVIALILDRKDCNP